MENSLISYLLILLGLILYLLMGVQFIQLKDQWARIKLLTNLKVCDLLNLKYKGTDAFILYQDERISKRKLIGLIVGEEKC